MISPLISGSLIAAFSLLPEGMHRHIALELEGLHCTDEENETKRG